MVDPIMESPTSPRQPKRLPFTSAGFLGSLFFTWITPLFDVQHPRDIDFRWMPDLPRVYTHAHYAPRIRWHFDQMFAALPPTPSFRTKKLFFIRLIFAAFRWDILLITLLSVFEKLLVFSAAYLFQRVLEIPASIDPSLFFDEFLRLGGALLLVKALFSVVTEALGFYIVS